MEKEKHRIRKGDNYEVSPDYETYDGSGAGGQHDSNGRRMRQREEGASKRSGAGGRYRGSGISAERKSYAYRFDQLSGKYGV